MTILDKYDTPLKIDDYVYFPKCETFLKGKIYYLDVFDDTIGISWCGYRFLRHSYKVVSCNSPQSMIFLLENL